MSKLDDLLKLKGVFAAGHFDDAGTIVDFRVEPGVDLPNSTVERTAQYCATVDMSFETLAQSFSDLENMTWTPRIGWVYAGGELTVAVSNNFGVFAKTFEVNFDDLFNGLVGPHPRPATT